MLQMLQTLLQMLQTLLQALLMARPQSLVRLSSLLQLDKDGLLDSALSGGS